MVNAVAEFLPVNVLAAAGRPAAAAKRHVCAEVKLFDIATNDTWIRDFGPTFIHENEKLVGIDWQFNAWGGKYPPWDDDDAAARQICNLSSIECESSKLTLEGGAIEGDGQGRLLTTPICVQTSNRNRGWSRDRISRELHKRLGVTEIVWIDGGGMEGDDTDGHIDQLARFVTPHDVVVAVSSDPADPNAVGLNRNRAQLMAWAEQTSPVVTIHSLPTPPPREIDGERMPESYCNFLLLGDKAVIVPTFGDRKSDQRAIGILRELRPNAKVVGIDASDFIWGRGAWHCASQQQPVAPKSST
jgi:agmatine deiminase